jgi:glycosyltransferase involved in cell wall biosynthesis
MSVVLHVTDSTEFGGAEQALLTLVRHTDTERWTPVLAHHRADAIAPLVEGARAAGVATIAVPRMPPGVVGLRRTPAFASIIRGVRPKVVHLHLCWPLACQYPLVAARLARVPAVVATVQLHVRLQLSRRVFLQQRLLTSGVDRYVAVSHDMRDRLVADLTWPLSKIDVVHNAAELTGIGPACVDPDLRRTAGNRALVLTPARLTDQKGLPHLLHAVASLDDVFLAVAGDGPDRDELEALAADLGLTERIVFLGHRRDVPALLAAADVVVLPSLWEGLPLALLEAMASGTPVISTRVGGIPELIVSGCNGLLVEPGDSAALAAAIRELLDDRDLAGRFARRAAADVADRFSASAMADKVMTIYDELTAR